MTDEVSPHARRVTLAGIIGSTLVTLALWYALYHWLPEPAGASPMSTALACAAIAVLLALVAGVEAVAHERLVTAAIDPLAGVETRRLRVNYRYLSNTVEQYIVFVAGLLALAVYASPRMLIVVTIVWLLSRWAFWIGYHFNPLLRGIGAPGMMQSMIVLLYVAYRFGTESYGAAAGIGLLAIFALIEAFLFRVVTRPAQ